MLLIFVSPLMFGSYQLFTINLQRRSLGALRCGYSLPFEGEAESDVRNSFPVVERRRDRAIRIELYRKQYDH